MTTGEATSEGAVGRPDEADAERHRAELRGERLYGDALGPEEIAAWYEGEREGYANLGAADASRYRYGYHALNQHHGWGQLPPRRYAHALGMGSAYGDEFQPIADRIERLTMLEPSDAFVRDDVHGIPARFVKPETSGTLPFPDAHFDLISCLGVLHHIPNVSHVLAEMRRCLEPGGHALVREPIVSMGDWTRPRRGLTRNERGIPLDLFREAIDRAGFRVLRESLCVFPLTRRIWRDGAFLDPRATAVDALLARLMAWNLRYHATTPLQKLRPTSAYYVLTRD